MVAQLVPQEHPVLAALTTAREALVGVAEVQPMYMTPAQQETAIVDASALEASAAACGCGSSRWLRRPRTPPAPGTPGRGPRT